MSWCSEGGYCACPSSLSPHSSVSGHTQDPQRNPAPLESCRAVSSSHLLPLVPTCSWGKAVAGSRKEDLPSSEGLRWKELWKERTERAGGAQRGEERTEGKGVLIGVLITSSNLYWQTWLYIRMFCRAFTCVRWQIGSHINNLVLVVSEQSISPYMPTLWWMMPSYPPSQILPLVLAFNFQLGALSLDHFQCLEKLSWSFKHKHMSSLPSYSHRSYGFPVQGMFPMLLTLRFTPQLVLVVWHLSKKDRTSKQRCVTCEVCAEPCKPLPDGNGCPERFISKWDRQPNFGSLTCVAIGVELQHWGYLSITPAISDSRKSSSRRVLQLEWVNRWSFVVLICLSIHW